MREVIGIIIKLCVGIWKVMSAVEYLYFRLCLVLRKNICISLLHLVLRQ